MPLGETGAADAEATVGAWCERAGHEFVGPRDGAVVVRRGPAVDHLAALDPALIHGTRWWIDTNVDCNLACDYFCARSSPQADRNGLGLDLVRRLAAEAVDADVSELILTGGEPFLLPDLDQIIASCTAALPATLLTNGTLFGGHRLAALRGMDPERLTLQISLDSATADPHDLVERRG